MSPRRAPQDGSKRRPAREEAPKTTQERAQERTKGAQRPPGPHFRAFLGVLFEPRARSARQTKALVEIIAQKVFRDRCGPDVQRPLSTKLLK